MLKIYGKNYDFAIKNGNNWEVTGSSTNTKKNNFIYVINIWKKRQLDKLADDTPIYASNNDFKDKMGKVTHITKNFTDKAEFELYVKKLVDTFYKHYPDLSHTDSTVESVSDVMIMSLLMHANGKDMIEICNKLIKDVDKNYEHYADEVRSVMIKDSLGIE